MIPAEILRDVAARMREADAEGWPVRAENFTDDALIDSIAACIIGLKARGYGDDRCPSTSQAYQAYGGVRDLRFRCTEATGHAGKHVNGALSWFHSGTVTDAVPCGAAIRVQPQRWAAHACTRPSGHDGAHGDGALLWCDPSPIPQAADMTDYEGWDDCINSAVTIYNRPTATEDK